MNQAEDVDEHLIVCAGGAAEGPCKVGCLYMRRCQIKVQFDSGAKIKFMESLFKPMTSQNYKQISCNF